MFLFPRDWQVFHSDQVGVVYKAEFPPGSTVNCVLWSLDDYTHVSDWQQRKVLATADLFARMDGLTVFFFHNLLHYGSCVISVIVVSDLLTHDDRAIHLVPARMSTASATDKRLTLRPCEGVRYPLAEVWTEHSNYQQVPAAYDGKLEMVEFVHFADKFTDAPEAPGTVRMAICHKVENHVSEALLVDYCHGIELVSQPADWQARPTYYALLQNVTASLLSGLVVFEDKYRWGDSCPSPDFVDPDSTLLPGSFRHDGRRGIVDMQRWAFCERDVLPMIATNAGRGNYGHWLQNSMLAMFFVRDAINAGKILPVTPPLTAQQKRLLELIGISTDRILETREAAIFFPKAIYPSFISTHAGFQPGTWALECYNVIHERAYRGYSETPPDYIYFTRKGFAGGHKRGIENEDELIDMLRGLGFAIIAPHENSFDENLYLIRRAKVIVSQLGAAMADIAFAPAGCVVIELSCDHYFNNSHLYMTHLFGQKLIRIVSPLIPGTVDTPEGFRFHVPIDKVRRAALASTAG
jgi:hypothetical protein